MTDYKALWDELTNDPASIGYLDPNDKDNEKRNVELINDPVRSQSVDSISQDEFWEVIDPTELNALKDANLEMYRHLRLIDSIDTTLGTQSRNKLDTVFPPGGTTGGRIANLLQETTSISRAEELGFGQVYTSDMKTARERYGS